MKKRNYKSLITGLCLGSLILVFLVLFSMFLIKNIMVDWLGIDNGLTRLVLSAETADTAEAAGEAETDQTDEATGKLQALADYYTTDALPFRSRMVLAERSLESLAGWNISRLASYNSIVDLGDGYLVSYMTKLDLTENAEAIEEFGAFCSDLEIPLLYIQAPGKLSKYEDTDVVNKLDFSNQRADSILAGLDTVASLDLREEIAAENLSHHDLFFNTDHHWKPETGLWAAGVIAQRLNQDYGLDLDLSLLDESQYNKQVYEDWFLGSEGKKVTLAKCEPDDISLLYPAFETNITMEIPKRSLNQTGAFDIIYYMYAIDPKDYMNKNPYGAYCYSDNPLVRLENHLADNDLKVLVIKDSFGNTVCPFLALTVSELDMIDLRHYTDSLEDYIREYQPDCILILYNTSGLDLEEAETGTSKFDFR